MRRQAALLPDLFLTQNQPRDRRHVFKLNAARHACAVGWAEPIRRRGRAKGEEAGLATCGQAEGRGLECGAGPMDGGRRPPLEPVAGAQAGARAAPLANPSGWAAGHRRETLLPACRPRPWVPPLGPTPVESPSSIGWLVAPSPLGVLPLGPPGSAWGHQGRFPSTLFPPHLCVHTRSSPPHLCVHTRAHSPSPLCPHQGPTV